MFYTFTETQTISVNGKQVATIVTKGKVIFFIRIVKSVEVTTSTATTVKVNL